MFRENLQQENSNCNNSPAIIFSQNNSDVEVIGDAGESGGVILDIVQFGNLRGAVSEKVGNLFGRECLDRTVWLFDSVHKVGCKGASER